MFFFALLLPMSSWASDAPAPRPHDCVRLHRGYARPVLPDTLISQTHPIQVWYDSSHDNSVEIAPAVLASMEHAWEVQVNDIGFLPPTLPDVDDGPNFDVYLIRYYPFSAYVAADYTPDVVAGDGYNSQSSYMVIDRRMPMEYVDAYVAHEFNHASQWSYDFSEFTLPIWEGTASAAERWTLGPTYDWAQPVASFQEVPFMPTLVGDATYVYEPYGAGYYFEYGASLWVMWLDEFYGDGQGSAGVALWEATANEGYSYEPDAVDAFAEVAGMPMADALGEFAIARFLTGRDWDDRGLSEAAEWGPARRVPADPLTADDLPLAEHPPTMPAFVTGQSFLDLDLTRGTLPDGADAATDLRITVGSASGLESALTVLWWHADGTVGDDVVSGATPHSRVSLNGLERVVIAITNVGPRGWDGDDDPYALGDHTVSVQFETDGVIDNIVRASPRSGCGCASGGRAASGLVVVLGGLLLRRRRRATAAPRSER